jgi:hypothetical protein
LDACACFKKIESRNLDGGDTALPIDMWSQCISKIVDTYEPTGIVGIGVIMSELSDIALACKDLRLAVRQSMVDVGRIINMKNPIDAGMPWLTWDNILKNPTSFKLDTLKQACRFLDIKVSGLKAELIVRILEAFKLKAPMASFMSARILWELCEDYKTPASKVKLPINRRKEYIAYTFNENKVEFQRRLSIKFGSLKGLVSYDREQIIKYDQDQIQIAKKNGNCMLCKANPYAKSCGQFMCGTCCRTNNVSCPRHKTY